MSRSTPAIIATYGPDPTLISKNVIPKMNVKNDGEIGINVFIIELIPEIHIYASIIASILEPKHALLSFIPAKAIIIVRGYSKIVVNLVLESVIY
ncbi:MAG: hypothetical protein QXU89_03755 [Desulfurococcaceae archaeon]